MKKSFYRRALIFFLALAFAKAASWALPVSRASAEPLDFESAWRVIREHNPGLRAARQSVDAAYASMKLSGVQTRVTASLSGTSTKEDGDRSSSSAGVSLSYSTSLFGRENALVSAERSALREAETSLAARELSLYRQTAVSFWGAAAGEASVRASREEISRREAFLEDARLRFQQGMVPELDVLRAESALAEARHSLALSEASRSGFEAMLKGLAGWREISPVEGLFDLDLDMGSRTVPPDFQNTADHHPSVLKEKWSVEKAGSLLRAARLMSLPTLSLTATRTLVTDGAASLQYTQDEWWGRATLSIPVIDGGQTKWSVEKARAGLAAAESALGSAKAEVMMSLFTAWEDYMAAQNGLEAEKIRFDLVSRERDIVLLRYREGLANQIEVLDAQTRFTGSLASLINAKRGLLVAEAALASAEGRIPGEESN
jgi:outer membrane protein TolC